jgi:DNA primase
VETPTGPAINEWVLGNYKEMPDRLIERRNLSREAINAFEIKWDSDNKTWVIPIRTPEGELMGFQFRQKGIVINHPPGMEKSKTLFGLHLFKGESRITIVESPLDAVRLFDVGVPAVSSFGASISSEQLNLLSRNFRYVVAAMDNDAVGRRANEIIHRTVGKRGCAVFDFDYLGLEAKDPGDIETNEALRAAWDKSISLNMTRL